MRGGKLGNQHLKLRYKIMFFMPTPTLFICFLCQYNSGTQKLVKTPFIDSILLNILQFLKLISSKIDKQGVGGPNKVRGGGKNFRK